METLRPSVCVTRDARRPVRLPQFVDWLTVQPEAARAISASASGCVALWSSLWTELPATIRNSPVGFSARIAIGDICEVTIEFAAFINRVRFADISSTAAAPTEHFWMQMTLTRHDEAPEFCLPSSSYRGDFAVWAGTTR